MSLNHSKTCLNLKGCAKEYKNILAYLISVTTDFVTKDHLIDNEQVKKAGKIDHLIV